MLKVTNEAKQFLQTNQIIKNFESVKYKSNGECMNFLSCLETIVGDKNAELLVCKKGLVLGLNNKFYLVSEMDCPTPSYMDFEAYIMLSSKEVNLTCFFGKDEQDLTCARMESENGMSSKYYSNGKLVYESNKLYNSNNQHTIY